MTHRDRTWIRRLGLIYCWLLLAGCSQAQTQSPERSFPASPQDVQKALHQIPSYPGGKLPTLEGFADPAGRSPGQL